MAEHATNAQDRLDKMGPEDAGIWVDQVDEDYVMQKAEEAVGNWQQFQDFGWHEHPEDAENWTLVYTSNRDSGLVEQANAMFIDKVMSFFPEDEVRPQSHGHWAVGHVSGYAIRVYNADGTPTNAFKAWCSMNQMMEEQYPLLDDSLYSELEYNETLDNIEEAGRGLVAEGAPSDWAGEVFGWLWDNDQEAVSGQDDRGGYPSDDQIRKALAALGYLEEEHTEEGEQDLQFDKGGRVMKGLKDESVSRIAATLGAKRTAQEGTHEGYKNYATWGVALIIANDRGRYEYWQEVAQEVSGDALPSVALADRLKEEIEAEVEEASSGNEMVSQLLQAGLSEVDWDEVAEDILSK